MLPTPFRIILSELLQAHHHPPLEAIAWFAQVPSWLFTSFVVNLFLRLSGPSVSDGEPDIPEAKYVYPSLSESTMNLLYETWYTMPDVSTASAQTFHW